VNQKPIFADSPVRISWVWSSVKIWLHSAAVKISLKWLADYLPGPLEAGAAADALLAGGLPVESIESVHGDTVIDVEVTSNRSDCLSHLGVARELSALLDRPYKDVTPTAKESNTPASSATTVAIEALDLCPHYTARIIRNVKIGPSPAWMIEKLEAIGVRPINNVVDVTNFVLFEMGQPLHAFDLDRLSGQKIIVRRARSGEKIVSIDGHERTLATDMLVISDAQRPVALAGVMGGKDSEVSEGTVNILLESARFDPLSVRKTARALTMKSDSSYRFERGIDPTLPARASLRAAQLILETAGGELLKGIVEAGATGYAQKQFTLRPEKVRQVLGVEFPIDQIIKAMERQHLKPRMEAGKIAVSAPSWRLDINLEVDLVEEVARTIGYEKIPVKDEISIRLTPPDRELKTTDLIWSTLVASGYFEAVTFSWVSDALAQDFVGAGGPGLPRAEHSVRKADGQLRPSLIPALLEAVRRNESAGTSGARLFEIGAAFNTDGSGNIVERRFLAMVGALELHELRGAVEELLNRLDPDKAVTVKPSPQPGFAPGTAGSIAWGTEVVGRLGQIDRAVAGKVDLCESPWAAEMDIDALLRGAATNVTLKPLPRFPAVRRDLSLVISDATRYEAVERIIRESKPEMLEKLEYVTTYRGKPLEKGQKSITVTLVFRSPTTTLTSEQVEGSVQKVVDAAKRELGATLRT